MRRITLLCCAQLTLASGLMAQSERYTFGTQCITGSFRACLSVDVELLYHTAPGEGEYPFNLLTEVRITMSNPQGLRGYEYGPRGYRSVRIHGLESESNIGVGWFSRRQSSTGTVFLGPWDPVDSPDWDVENGDVSVFFSFDAGSRFFGCDVPDRQYADVISHDGTCGGSITYVSWIARDHLTFSKQPSLSFHATAWDDRALDVAEPYTSADCTTGVDCVVSTPEPASLALMATGLAGLGSTLARRRRRRVASP